MATSSPPIAEVENLLKAVSAPVFGVGTFEDLRLEEATMFGDRKELADKTLESEGPVVLAVVRELPAAVKYNWLLAGEGGRRRGLIWATGVIRPVDAEFKATAIVVGDVPTAIRVVCDRALVGRRPVVVPPQYDSKRTAASFALDVIDHLDSLKLDCVHRFKVEINRFMAIKDEVAGCPFIGLQGNLPAAHQMASFPRVAYIGYLVKKDSLPERFQAGHIRNRISSSDRVLCEAAAYWVQCKRSPH